MTTACIERIRGTQSLDKPGSSFGFLCATPSDVRNLTDCNGPCKHESTTFSPTGSFTVPTFDWNDCMSSLKVAPGWRATIYRDEDFKGQSLEVTGDVPNLQLVPGSCDRDGLNDCITSIRVRQQ